MGAFGFASLGSVPVLWVRLNKILSFIQACTSFVHYLHIVFDHGNVFFEFCSQIYAERITGVFKSFCEQLYRLKKEEMRGVGYDIYERKDVFFGYF